MVEPVGHEGQIKGSVIEGQFMCVRLNPRPRRARRPVQHGAGGNINIGQRHLTEADVS